MASKKRTFISMKTKTTALVVAAVLLCAIFFSLIGVHFISEQCALRATETMYLTCKSEAVTLNERLLEIEYSLGIMSKYITDNAPTLEETQADDTVFEEHLEATQYYFDALASINPGIVAYYYRYYPEIFATTHGFFLHDSDGDGVVETHELTDITAYAADDLEHTGWYYIPAQTGEPLWMDPYWNANSETYIISYEIPLINDDGEVFGIIGMDIDFNTIADEVLKITSYETGRAALLTSEGIVAAHADLPIGTDTRKLSTELAAAAEQLSTQEESEELITYTYNNVEKELMFCALRNGMRLVLYVPANEINAGRTHAVTTFLTVALLAAVVGILVTRWMAARMTNSLTELTKTAQKIGEGKLNAEFPEKSNDEIGVLNETMQSMAHEIRQMVGGLSDRAYRDALTGVRNKGAFEEETKRLDEGKETFAIAMFDVNYLKTVNDTYGHEKGDQYLKTACSMICNVFKHCPVFRMGGDEFTAVLTNEQVGLVDGLFAEMDRRVAEFNADKTEKWQQIDVAKGYAVFKIASARFTEHPVQAILKQADEAMYKDKGSKRR